MKIIPTTRVFERNYNSTKYLVLNRGGSRSGKTFSITQLIARWLITGEIRKGQIIKRGLCSIVRKTLPSLKRSVLRDFEENLKICGWFGLVKVNKTHLTYTYKERCVEFFSIDDSEKVKGSKREILYINEANQINFEGDFIQLMIRTAGGCVFLDLNPSDAYTWVNTEIEQKRLHNKCDVDLIVSTYKDNPYLQQQQIDELLNIENPNLRDVYIYGQYGRVEGLVYENWQIIKKMPPTELIRRRACGLDFGFNDPTALVHVGVGGPKENWLFVDCLLYKRYMTPDEMQKQISLAFKENKISKTTYIHCDSARPGLIRQLKNKRLNAKAVKKAKNSIRDGINLLKNYHIFVTSRSVELIKELQKYSWKTDQNEKAIEGDPVDAFNHALDALRYYAISNLNKLKTVKSNG